jgi:hypothetical protein
VAEELKQMPLLWDAATDDNIKYYTTHLKFMQQYFFGNRKALS